MSTTREPAPISLDEGVRARIESAFLSSREKYLRDAAAEGAAGEAAAPEAAAARLDAQSAEWLAEVAAMRERKKQRISKGYFSEESRRSLQRVLRQSMGGGCEAAEAVAAVSEGARREAAAVAEVEASGHAATNPARVSSALPVDTPVRGDSDRAVLEAIHVGSLLRADALVTVGEGAHVREVLEVMAQHEVSAVPVVDAGGRVVGLVEAGDVMRGLLEELRDDSSKHDIEHFMNTATARTLVRLPHVKAHWHALAQHDTLAHALTLFGSGIHRCVVVDNDKHAIGILSQSSVAHLFASHSEVLGGVGDAKIQDVAGLMVPREEIEAVTPGTPAWLAFHHMCEKGVQSVALVDTAGTHLQGEVSARTLRGLRHERVHLLAQPLQKLLPPAPYGMRLSTVTPDAPVSRLIDLMVQSRRQRVWVVAPGTQNHLVGLVTFTDLARILSSQHATA